MFETTPADGNNYRVAPKPRTRSASQPWVKIGTERHTFSARGDVVAYGPAVPSLRGGSSVFWALLSSTESRTRTGGAERSAQRKLVTFLDRGEPCVSIS